MAVRDVIQAAAGALGGGDKLYVEDVFSTYLYTGNGSTQAISNGINLGDSTVLQIQGTGVTDLSPTPKTLTPTNVSTSSSVTKWQSTSLQMTSASSSKIDVTSAPTLSSGCPYTIEFWLYRTGVNGSNYSILFGGLSQTLIWATSGQLWGYGYGQGAAAGTVFANNEWHHFAVVNEPGVGVSIYGNGVRQFQTATNYATDISQIFGYSSTGYSLAGYVDDFVVTPFAKYTGSSFSVPTASIPLGESGEGGLVWIKSRSGPYSNRLFDTERGVFNSLASDTDNDQTSITTGLTSFNSNGFSLGDATSLNFASYLYSSWTFRKAPKFFDVVTYTGTGSARTVAHSLGSTPGCIIVKEIDGLDNWVVYHTSIGATKFLLLNTTAASATGSTIWNNTSPTSTEFTVGTSSSTNQSGRTYVAYLFAHNAGGFGGDGLQNVVSCGSFTTEGTGISSVNLGYEPQFVLYKPSTSVGDWVMADNIRQLIRPTSGTDNSISKLAPNLSSAEVASLGIRLTSTGFDTDNSSFASKTFIYIAIRRGPMKTPESGTEVFQPVDYTSTNVDNRLVETGIVTDMVMARARNTTSSLGFVVGDRLRGDYFLGTAVTNAEATDADSFDQVPTAYGNAFSMQNGFGVGNDATQRLNYSSYTEIAYAFKRAPGFFDVVCYTGDGSNGQQISHNLGVVPELVIVKCRSNSTTLWPVLLTFLPRPPADGSRLVLNATDAYGPANDYFTNSSGAYSNATCVSDTFFSVGSSASSGASSRTYVAYLFASCPGVSKVGSYTGTGTTNQINCGFTGGARFVLIKRTDSTGDWYVWDSARGIVSGNDPYLLLNSTAAEVTSTDYVDTYSTGFEISSTAPAEINANGGTFIYLAIA